MRKFLALLFLSVQILVGFAFVQTNAFAQSTFTIKRIQFDGLQNISQATALRYVPVKPGQALKPGKTGEILRSLYQTGFFDHITLARSGNILVIDVVERPTIGKLTLTGNSVLPTDKLKTVMNSVGIAEGDTYNPEMIVKLRMSLLNQYYQLGRYNARVDFDTTPMSRNRVVVKLTISEGLVAKIKGITIIGNHVFSEKTLIKQLDVTSAGLFTFFTQTDRYSEQRLQASLDKLRGYYMDHGYLHVNIKAAQAQISPNRKSVYVTIVVTEGEPYIIESYDIQGDLILPRSDYIKLMKVKSNTLFSRQNVLDSEKVMTQLLGDHGYLFANIALQPQINDQTHRVSLVFVVTPGKRTYVHHVTFSDNTRTNDLVLRREIEQMEAAPASSTKLNSSKHNLSMLPYIKNVDMNVNPVPGSENQVDVNYKVEETNSANASLKVGYSQLYGLILGAGLDQKNFLGTGNTLGIDFTRSEYQDFYSISYTNPYYTEDGVSRTFNLSVSRVDPAGADIDTGYTTDEYDLGVQYGIPVGQQENAYNRIQVGATYENTLINLTDHVPNQVTAYLNNDHHGRRTEEMDFKAGFSHSSLDRALLPTRGTLQTLFADLYAPLDRESVTFYQLNYSGRWYAPLNESFIFLTRGDLGYGNGLCGFNDCIKNYPFFRNYNAGGIDSVRGFRGFTLGPYDSLDNPFGGNALVDASVGLIFPNYISDNVRTTVFVDTGNVYYTGNNRNFGGASTNSGPLRYSTGVELDWLTPFGPLKLSLAKPFRRAHDKNEPFQFALEGNF